MISFGEIYELYAGDVFRFAWYLSGDRSRAEDIASEAFVRLWTAADPVRPATVKAYLFTIARNLYLQSLRSSGRNAPIEDSIPDSGIGPEAAAGQKQELGVVFKGMKQLPEADRAALLMLAVDEMSYEEIAAVLGLSLSTVKVRIHRARIKLAQLTERSTV